MPARQLLARTNMLLPGLYAWASTVAALAIVRGAPVLARVLAMLALVALVAGPLLALERPRLGRAIGVFVFVGLCLLTWLTTSSQISVQQLEPVRAGLGAVGWALFALGWGTFRSVGSVPEEDPHAIVGAPLPARSKLAKRTLIVFSLGLVGSLIPLLLAWRVVRPGHALLAQAAAITCAVAVITSAARIALAQGSWQPQVPPRGRVTAASRPLALLTVMLALGMVWTILR